MSTKQVRRVARLFELPSDVGMSLKSRLMRYLVPDHLLDVGQDAIHSKSWPQPLESVSDDLLTHIFREASQRVLRQLCNCSNARISKLASHCFRVRFAQRLSNYQPQEAVDEKQARANEGGIALIGEQRQCPIPDAKGPSEKLSVELSGARIVPSPHDPTNPTTTITCLPTEILFQVTGYLPMSSLKVLAFGNLLSLSSVAQTVVLKSRLQALSEQIGDSGRQRCLNWQARDEHGAKYLKEQAGVATSKNLAPVSEKGEVYFGTKYMLATTDEIESMKAKGDVVCVVKELGSFWRVVTIDPAGSTNGCS